MWVKATENIKSTIQIYLISIILTTEDNPDVPFSQAHNHSLPTSTRSKDNIDSHFIKIMVKATLHEIPQLSLSAYFSVSLSTLSSSLQSEKKTCSSFFPITIYFRSNILLSPWESSPLLYIFDSVSSSDYKYASVFFRIRSLPQICHSPPVIQSSSFDYITSAKTSSTPSCLSSSQ